MTNVKKLKEIMERKNITYKMLSDKLDLDAVELDKKLGTEEEFFTIGEADIIVKLLDLNVETATEIFSVCSKNEIKYVISILIQEGDVVN